MPHTVYIYSASIIASIQATEWVSDFVSMQYAVSYTEPAKSPNEAIKSKN